MNDNQYSHAPLYLVRIAISGGDLNSYITTRIVTTIVK